MLILFKEFFNFSYVYICSPGDGGFTKGGRKN